MREWQGATDSPSWSRVMSAVTGGLAFDIGANIGQAALILAPNFRKVVSFEPCVEAFNLLENRMPGNVECVPIAVSDHEGEVELAETTGSLPTGQLTSGGDESMGWGKVTGWRSCPCLTVDMLCSMYGTPDCVKIDVEGHEMAVLAGAMRLIGKRAATWLIEMHSRKYERIVYNLFDDYDVVSMDHDYAPKPHPNFYMRCVPK